MNSKGFLAFSEIFPLLDGDILMESSSSTASTSGPAGAIRKNKAIAKRACDQCKFRKIKVSKTPAPHLLSVIFMDRIGIDLPPV
jgi:hypothetical protein